MPRATNPIPMTPMQTGLPAPPAAFPADAEPARGGALPTAPSEAQCEQWWDRFGMPQHIRVHSRQVARVACFLARAAIERGLPVCLDTVRASALLHDLAKAYCIVHGGSHSQLGGAWAVALTGNPLIAQGVTHHVYWPFPVDVARHFTPLAVLYGDKRVAHENIVPLTQRFDDLISRYGTTPELVERIHVTNRQGSEIEQDFARLLEIDLTCASF